MVTRPPVAELPNNTPKPCFSQRRAVVGGMDRIVQRLGEDVVAERDVVVRTPDARDLVDRPAEGAMIDDDVRSPELSSVPSILSASRLAGSGPVGSSPMRKRRCWMSTSEVWILNAAPRIMMPGDGAVWPAMVSLPLRMVTSLVSVITPEISKMQVRGPVASMQAFNEPAPLGLEIGHAIHGAAATRGRAHAVPGRARNYGNRVSASRSHGTQNSQCDQQQLAARATYFHEPTPRRGGHRFSEAAGCS